MSIPQICPSCGNHISAAHATGCCYGTPEYTHLGWPSYQVGAAIPDVASVTDSHWGKLQDSATAIRRLLEYLTDETEERPLMQPEPMEEKVADISDKTKILCRLNAKCNELRKEAAGIYNVEARAKRNFAADILESLIEEETSAW